MDSMIGRTFGRLTVVGRDAATKRAICSCECGASKSVHASNLMSGRTQSCGCLQKERVTRHGAAGTPTYKSWRSMVNRCTNPNDPSYPRYAGQGVKVAREWLDFDRFLQDMGERPAGTSIDRIDPSGDYCKENCRWATASQQARNHRKAAPLIDTPLGPMRVCEAAEVSGISANLIRARRRLRWPASRLFDPVNPRFQHPHTGEHPQ